MAIVNPAPGDRILADPINMLLNPKIFIATCTATQSFANGTNTAAAFDNETTDPYGGHSNVTNNSRYTVPAALAGYRFEIFGLINWAANATGAREAWVYLNSAIVGASFVSGSANGGGSFGGLASTRTSFVVASGDIIEIGGVQTSGGALATVASSNRFEITFGGLT